MKKYFDRSTLKSSISFSFFSNRLHVEIETDRLLINSYIDDDFENCISLYGDKSITKYFDYGRARSRSEASNLIREKTNSYFTNEKPFGLFSIFNKKEMVFIGQIDLLPTDDRGVMEIGFILHEQYHHQGFCTEAVKAIIFDYVSALNNRDIKYNESYIDRIIATVHPENQSCRRILQNIGMTLDKIQERFGNPRLWYSISTVSIIKTQKIGSR